LINLAFLVQSIL